jgi:DNA-binding transcriptional MocR family regulator
MQQTGVGETRTQAVMRLIRQRIEARLLTPGARLPSLRALADNTGFSKSTIVEAYERLAAEGIIRSRPGAGFYVAAPLAPLALAAIGAERDPQIDPMWMLRQALSTSADGPIPGCGWLPPDWMADEAIRKGLRQLARGRDPAPLVGHSSPAGSEALRRVIARRLLEQGVEAAPHQILLTDSATHAVDLVLRFLLEPGDAVLIDDPGYFNFQALLRAHRVKAIGVPMTQAGPDLTALERLAEEHRPRLYITNGPIHNPTGITATAQTVHRVLKCAETHDLVIIEDDIYADFEEEPAPRLAAFDGLDRVIRVSGFSKSLSGGVRLGYVAARQDWIAAITDLRIATGLWGSPLAAELVLTALSDGSYRRHMEKVRARLARARHDVARRLRAIGIEPWIEPAAGLFLWCRLPGGVDAAEVARRGLSERIVFAPGNVFSVGQHARDFMRFNAALSGDETIYAFLQRALEAEPGERVSG